MIVGIVLPALTTVFGLIMEADQSLYNIAGINDAKTQSTLRIVAFVLTLLVAIFSVGLCVCLLVC